MFIVVGEHSVILDLYCVWGT